ncbi:(2Fe-2S)-binding protein [Kitasatospora sp. NPDC001539]|uniref:(2Fe-2S)-binding protein n=1 Tax=Kitasatospora sp. NPDC001539 TaxID=3154384 RepID=UPI003321D9C4
MTASSTRPGPAPYAPRTAGARAHAPAPDSPTPCAPSYHRLAVLDPVVRVRCAPPRPGDGRPDSAGPAAARLIPAGPICAGPTAPDRTGTGPVAAGLASAGLATAGLTIADLAAEPAAVRAWIAHDAREGLARYGRPLRPDVAAGFGLHRFVWPVSLLFTVPWFLERRVPLLGPGDVSVRRAAVWDSGADSGSDSGADSGAGSSPGPVELTVRPEAFVCLPDDPAAASPQARTAPDEEALAAELRRTLGEFLEPVLAAFAPAVRRGPRVLWAMATDAVVEGLGYAGGLLGERERARAELTALLAPGEPAACAPGAGRCPAPAPAPFTPGAGFTEPAPAPTAAPDGAGSAVSRPADTADGPAEGADGASDTDRARASCCLVYTVEPADMCGGCPRIRRR